jgi:hypothetical protein
MTAAEIAVLLVTASLFLLTGVLRSAEAKPDEERLIYARRSIETSMVPFGVPADLHR